MTVQTNATLKSYFETGDKPTSAQFGDLVDTVTDVSGHYFTASGTGATARSLATKLDVAFIDVRDYGATGNNSTDDTAAIQAALNAVANSSPNFGGIVYFPRGYYKVSSKLYTTVQGTRFIGSNWGNTAIVPTTTDQTVIEIRHPYCEVSEMRIHQTGANSIGIAVKGAGFFSASKIFIYPLSTSTGTGILFDENDYNGSFASGSYFHQLNRCLIGYSSTNYHTYSLRFSGSINDCTALDCEFISDNPLYFDASSSNGGSPISGNRIIGGRVKSATGTIGTPVGTGITELNCVGNEFIGLYAEKLSTIYSAGNSSYGAQLGIHNDNCTTVYAASGTGKIPVLTQNYDGKSADTLKFSTQTVSSNGTALNTKSRVLVVTSAALRTSCTLSTSGVNAGQLFRLINTGPAIQVLNTNVSFVSGATSEYIGQSATTSGLFSVSPTMEFIFDGTNWVEINRSSYRMSQAPRSVNVTSNSFTITEVAISENLFVSTSSSSKTGTLLANGVLPGQKLTIYAGTSLLIGFASASNVRWASSSAPTISTTGGNQLSVSLIWDAGTSQWFETGRSAS